MSITNYSESWTDIYDKYKNVVNFVAGDFDSLKEVIRYYVTVNNPENYNDWA
jgi:thiamine pyrophosphokinase